MINPLPESSGYVLGFELTGKLHDDDYKQFVPLLEAAIKEHGKVRLLSYFHDFHGWDAKALWDDIKFDRAHHADFEKIALVGDKQWEKWMASVCKPFTKATVKYFDEHELPQAWEWVKS